MKKITILALLLTWGTATWAEENENQKTEEHKQVEESKRTSWNKYLHGYQYQARVAYNIGGTAPIGLPATIRTLHSYTLQPNFSLGIDAYHPLSSKWGFVRQKYNLNFGVMIQPQQSKYIQDYQGVHVDTVRNVTNISPTLDFRYRFSKMSNLRVNYRGTTSQP